MPTPRAPHHHPNSPSNVPSAVKSLDVGHLAPSSWPHPQCGRLAGNVKCLLLAWQEEDRKRRRGFLCKTCKNKTYLDSSLEMCLPKYTHTREYSDQLPYALQEFPCRRVPACPGERVSLSASGSLASCWGGVCVCVCVCPCPCISECSEEGLEGCFARGEGGDHFQEERLWFQDCYFNAYATSETIKNVYMPWRRKWQPIPVFLPGKSHGQRSLVGYNPWDRRIGHSLVTKQ